jgi:hypothetical protein
MPLVYDCALNSPCGDWLSGMDYCWVTCQKTCWTNSNAEFPYDLCNECRLKETYQKMRKLQDCLADACFPQKPKSFLEYLNNLK